MIDSGATSNFIHPRVIQRQQLHVEQKAQPQQVFTIDGTPLIGGSISQEINGHLVTPVSNAPITLDVANIGQHDVILGLPWLSATNPVIDWRQREFGKHCNIATMSMVSDLPLEYQGFADVFDPVMERPCENKRLVALLLCS